MATIQNNTNGFLRVPIRLQALCLDSEQGVVRAMANYRRLPFSDGATAHDDKPNLAESILTPPFSADLPLPAGIHLHWLLPEALAHGEQEETGTRFPHAPNRWLILRSGGEKEEKQWVVESDYLYPEGWGKDVESEGKAPVNLMAVPDPERGPGYRYRFVGRALTIDEWREEHADPTNENRPEYLPVLSAVGTEVEVAVLDPVRVTFASFYPNCRTVFGFHDPDFATRTPPSGLRYDVVGWYADPTRDCLAPLLAQADTAEALRELLEEKLEWTIDQAAMPGATLYHARLSFAPGARAARDVIAELPKPKLTIAQTETEAIAAYLAHVHAPETNADHLAKRRIVEDQLEALQLTDRLEGHTLDLDARLLEARHERGFGSLSAGIRWSIQPLTDPTEDVFAMFRRTRSRGARTAPPAAWAAQLDELNTLQEEYQRATDELESLRQRMFTRWHARTNAKQPVGDAFFKNFVVPVRRRLATRGNLRLSQDEATGAFRAEVEPVAFRIVTRAYGNYFKYERVLDAGQPFALSGTSNESYWTWAVEFRDSVGAELSTSHAVRVLQPKEAWEVSDRGVVYPIQANAEGITLTIPLSVPTIAGRLKEALAALLAAIEQHNATPDGAASPYALRALPAPPYWEAAEPVLLITGEAAAGAIWTGEGEDDLLPCAFIDLTLDLTKLPAATVTAIKDHLSRLGEGVGDTWAEAPWNPFMMHWSIQAAPCGRDDNGDYKSSLVRDHYTLGVQGIDQTLLPGHEAHFSGVADTYSGMSLLTPSGSLEVRDRIVLYLENDLLPDYYDAKNIPEDERVKGYLEAHFGEVEAWYRAQNPSAGIEDPVFTSLFAYAELEETPCLAQSFGNFNQVLLLREPVWQLPMKEITSSIDLESMFYTPAAEDAMGDAIQQRPLVMDRFNPLRAGALSVTGLRLVDTFGQWKDVVAGQGEKVITTTDLTPPGGQHQVLLSPRITQPARLRFEWLPAEPTSVRRTNDHPETNPVCGFLLVNNLDGALAVYDKEGRALGSIDRGNTWRTAPESGGRVRMSAPGAPELPNAHLQQVVRHVLSADTSGVFLEKFLSTQRTALETIDPEAYAECPSRALLMARAVAVVRASITLELQGPPAFDPSAVAENIDQDDGGTITTRGVEKVQFPIRLGEFAQLDDGLVGYFRETPDGAFEGGLFYSPQERSIGHPTIRTYADGVSAMEIVRTPEDPEQRVTLLLDPRAQVHATLGILPSPQIRLSPEHYARALEAMEVSFLTAPLLTDQGALRLAVPEEPGHTWSWVTQDEAGAWSETTDLAAPNPRAAFSAPQEIREGWLILRRTEGGEA